MGSSITRRAACALAVATLAACPSVSRAASVTANWVAPFTQNPPYSFSWGTAANWSTNPVYPNNNTPAGTTYDVVINTVGELPGVFYSIHTSLITPITIDSLAINSPSADLDIAGTLRAINGINLAGGGRVTVSGGVLTNTRVTGGSLRSDSVNSTLDNVTLANTTFTARSSGTLKVQNSLTLDNATIDLQGLRSGLVQPLSFVGGNTLGGSGQVIFNGGPDAYAASNRIDVDSGGLTIAPGVTIRSGSSHARINAQNNPLTNQGTISAQGGYFIDLGNVTNTGTLEAKTGGFLNLIGNWSNAGTIKIDGGTLTFGGVDTIAALGLVQRTGGTVQYTGTLNNAGNTLDLSTTPAGPLDFASGAAVNGGTLTSSNPAATPTVRFMRDEQTEDLGGHPTTFSGGVTLDTDLNVARGSVVVTGGGLTLLSGRTISLVAALGADPTFPPDTGRAELMFHNNSTLAGGGVVVFNGQSDANLVQSSGGNLTIASGITIRTGVEGGYVGAFSGSQFLINQGTIAAQTPGKRLVIRGPNFTNTGTLRADAGTLELAGNATTAGLGNIVITGGSLVFSGTLDNTANTFNTAAYPGATFKGTVVGGSVVATAAAPFVIPPGTIGSFGPVGGATLRNLNFTGPLRAGAAATLTLSNNVTFTNATVQMLGGGSVVSFQPTSFGGIGPTVGGTAEITFENGPSTITGYQNTTLGALTFRTRAAGATPVITVKPPPRSSPTSRAARSISRWTASSAACSATRGRSRRATARRSRSRPRSPSRTSRPTRSPAASTSSAPAARSTSTVERSRRTTPTSRSTARAPSSPPSRRSPATPENSPCAAVETSPRPARSPTPAPCTSATTRR